MPNQRNVIISLNAVLIFLTFCAISSRVARNTHIVEKFRWNDVFVVIAAVSGTVFSMCMITGTDLGLGDHQANVDPANIPDLQKLLMASIAFYFLCNWAIKHGLLLFYSQIVREDKRAHRVAIAVMHVVAFGFGLSSILVEIFRCRPFRKTFHPDIRGTCIDIEAFFYYNACVMLAMDIVLYAMPVVFTWGLEMRRAQRVGLNCLFGLGGLVLAASAARIWSVHMFVTKPDLTWRIANVMIWSSIENHLAVAVACAPSIKVAATLLFPHLASALSKHVCMTFSHIARSEQRASVALSTCMEREVRLQHVHQSVNGEEQWETRLSQPSFVEGGAERVRRDK